MGDPDRNTYQLFRITNPVAYDGALEELGEKLDYGREVATPNLPRADG